MLFSGIVKDREMVVCELKDGKLRTVYDLLEDGNITRTYPNLFLTSSSLDMPYLECEDSTDFSAVFDLLDSNEMPSDNIIIQIKSAIDDKIELSIEEYKLLYMGLTKLKSYFSEEKVVINFPKANFSNFRQTQDLVDKVRKKVGSFSVSDNKTLFRENENSELFIMVPSPDSLTLAEDLTSFIPSMKNVFVPFKEKELYTHNYKNYLKSNSLTPEMVLGDPNNNRFELYEEEQRYYDALKSLHNSLMEREHPNNTLEECIKYNEYSELFKNYISYMLTEVLRYHRNHSGFISLESYSDDDDNEDDDNESNEKSSAELAVNLFYSSNKKGNFDGEDIITALLEDQIKKDCYAPINILIQALRFGKKLPSKLELSDNRFFDLKKFAYSTLSGSFSNYTVQKTALGNNYKVLGAVNCNNKILDTEYAKSVGFIKPKLDSPIGLILKKSFVDSEEYQLTLISLIDLVSFLGVDENLTIDGISKVDGNILINESILDSEVLENSITLDEAISRLDYPRFISYINPYMKGDYMECGCFTNSLSTLNIFKDVLGAINVKNLNIFVVVSKEDVFDKIKTYRLAAEYLLRSTVGYYMLDQIVKADKKILDISMVKFSYTISDVISVYKDVVESCNYPLGVYTTAPEDSNVKPSIQEPSKVYTKLADSNAFGELSKENKNKDESVEVGGNMYNLDNLFYNGEFTELISVVLPTEIVNKVNLTYKELNKPFEVKVINSKDGVSVVGFLTRVDGAYVFLSPKTYEAQIKGKFTLTKFKSNILTILRTVAAGEIPKVKFDNLDTLNYYCMILEKC